MRSFPFFQCVAAVSGVCAAVACAQDAVQSLDPLIVRGSWMLEPWSRGERLIGSESLRQADAAALVARIPGAAVVRNGPQTGIVQMRGLSGDRVGVLVDGMTITPACPNHMDPPLHYADAGAGSQLEWFAGISPVSAGGDRIGGTVSVSRPGPVFAGDGTPEVRGELGASFLGSQDAASVLTELGYARGDGAVDYRGSAATADDLRFPGGTVSDSGYDMTRHGLTGAWRTRGGFIAVDGGYSATRDAGTPALPMDMVEDDAWSLGVTQQEKLDWGTLENRLFVHDIEHLMDNYSLRPVAMGGMRMEAPSSSRDFGWRGGVIVPRNADTLRAGVDLHRNEFEAEQVALPSGMRRDTFADNVRSRSGAYLDWERKWSDGWTSRAGLRGDLVCSDAGAVGNAILPPPGPMRDMILRDQAVFNAADRSFDDLLVDAVAALRFEPEETTSVELAVALKNRAPSLVERYLWTPLNASAGLADGRTYLGNLGLDPERSVQVALGIGKNEERWQVELTPFYQSVSDYIQGMPIGRMDMNGQPVLQYRNIDRAELYGFELAGEMDLAAEWSIGSSLSQVRGTNRETGDDLYRIAPLRGLVDLAWQREGWESHIECVWADRQEHVSDLQGESPSPGFAIFNLRLARTFAKSLRIEVGVENLLDKRYAEHTGGVNRVAGGDLAVGGRIPSAGRFGYTTVSWEF